MSGIYHPIVTLIAASSFQNMGNRFRRGGGSSMNSSSILIMLLVVVLIVVLVWVLSRVLNKLERRGYNSPRSLFRELCQVHHLDFKQRRTLRRLARSQRLAHPARLFLEPDRFDVNRLSPVLVIGPL